MKFKLPHPPSMGDLENMLGKAAGHHGNAAEMAGKAKEGIGKGQSMVGAQEHALKNKVEGSGLVAEAKSKAEQVRQGAGKAQGMVGEASNKAHELGHTVQQGGEAMAKKMGHGNQAESLGKQEQSIKGNVQGNVAEVGGKGGETLSKAKSAGKAGKAAGHQLASLGNKAEQSMKSLF